MTSDLTLAYIIFSIVILHLIGGFVWVFYKFSKKKSKKGESIRNDNRQVN